MEELVIKVEIPVELKERFEVALSKVLRSFVRNVEFSMANEILSKSEMSDEQIRELSDNLKNRVAKRHGL